MLLCAGAAFAAPGCADTAPFPEVDGPGLDNGPDPVALPNGGHVVSEYVLHLSPSKRTSTLRRLKPGVSARPGFKPQSVDNLVEEQDGTAGSGTANTVELATDPSSITSGTSCPSGITAAFCATVTLGSFYTRPLNNVFVQVTSITDIDGVDLAGHSGINGDATPSWLPDSGLGQWKHTATKATTAGVVGTTPNNFAARVWEFADPDGADTYITLRVVASLSYSNYSISTSPQSFLNACTTGTTTRPTSGFTTAVMGFPFSFYDVQATTAAKFTRDAVVTFGAGSPPSAANAPFANVNLPENPQSVSVSPALYAFWDQLSYSNSNSTQGATGLCHNTVGSAPNRRFVITWLNVHGFNDTTDTTNLTFSAIMTEGSDTIDLVYKSMLGTSANDPNVYPTSPAVTYAQRAVGKKAVIGVQGLTISTPFPAVRGALDTSTGKAYRFTPMP